MAEETHNTMNLDLNLGPGSVATEDEHVNVDEWVDDSTDMLREAVRRTSRRRWREHHSEDPFGSLSLDWNQFLASVSNQGGLHLGEGSVAVEERATEIGKMLENKADEGDDAALECDGEDEKGTGGEESFYDCNICFELAKDPIITCCGHLYCWSCIYQWLHYSEMKECPVCKGEVTTKNVTPIYGRGHNNRAVDEDLTLRIPPRPSARRVESVVRRSFPIPMEEMIRRLGNRFDLSREFSANQDMGSAADRYTNTSNMLNRIMMSRARERMRAPPENTVDLTQSQAASPNTVGVSRPQRRLIRLHAATSRSVNTSSPSPSSMSASERVMEAYIRSHPVIVRRPEQAPSVDDRDSFSSIAAVMNSGSQNIDTAVEIDSVLSLSTSSSRRNDTSRASDMDSGDSRPLRRRRLN